MYTKRQNTTSGWILFVIMTFNVIAVTLAYPKTLSNTPQYSQQYEPELAQQYANEPQQFSPVYTPQYAADTSNNADDNSADSTRKFAVKPNASKKVALDDIDEDIQTNQIQEQGLGGFSWTNMLATMMQMFFAGGGGLNSPTKSDDIDNGSFQQSPWANVISVGLKIFTTLLGGGAPSDGIDKVDNGNTGPMQSVLAAVLSSVLGARDPEQVNTMAKQAGEFINIVMNLLDALKTSFSHRSLTARSIGKRDSVSDAAVASISMFKGYVRTYKNDNDKCMQKYLCEANSECINEIGGTSIFCQLGTYATSFIIERTTDSKFENLYDAGRRGRSGIDCKKVYLECNEV